VRPIGHRDGEYVFITEAGEMRRWSSSQLHGRGGMADLFGGDLRWATRHYPGRNPKGEPTGRPNVTALMERLIWVCQRTAYLDAALQVRGVGTWRGPDGTPIVHAGDRIFYGNEILPPGSLIGDAVYAIGGARPAPAHVVIRHRGRQPSIFEWQPISSVDGLWVMNALDGWNWESEEVRQLYAGALFLNALGDAPLWKNHVFVQAPPEAGKSTLLRYSAALLGGSAGPLLKTYSKAYIESSCGGKALAVMDLGGTSGDGDQLGGLIAGWWTLVYEDEPDEDRIADVKRFMGYIRTLAEFEGGDGDAMDCFNHLLGAEVRNVRTNEPLYTVGQTIARARSAEVEAASARKMLTAMGLRLVAETPEGPWDNAYLAIANKHNALDEIFAKKTEWANEKWNQAMKELPGAQSKHPFIDNNPAVRFGGPQVRALFVPPSLLPNSSDE
jgi:hypothetical protein